MSRVVFTSASLIIVAVSAAIIAFIVVGGVLPRGDQMLFSFAPAWRPGDLSVFVLDVSRTIILPVAHNRTISNPGLPLSWSPDGQHIAYMSYPQRRETYVFDFANGQRQSLNSLETLDAYNAVWSPDGKMIAFMGGSSDLDIFVANADGSGVRNLTRTGSGYASLNWSPDSQQIAFNSLGANSEIYAVNLESGVMTNLTEHIARDMTPAWSPDGRSIAYISDRDGIGFHVYMMEADGSNVRRIMDIYPYDTAWSLQWSPDSRQIVYGSNSWVGGSDIYLVDVETRHVINVTNDDARDASPSWSPNGRWIAFESRREGSWNVYVADSKGDEVRRVTSSLRDSRRPIWSPDSRQIAYISNQGRGWNLYVIDVDSLNPVRLTRTSGVHFSPAWRPS